jgi:hypothetical protein
MYDMMLLYIIIHTLTQKNKTMITIMMNFFFIFFWGWPFRSPLMVGQMTVKKHALKKSAVFFDCTFFGLRKKN